jgi:hypothetical protein
VEYQDMNAIAAFSRSLVRREQYRAGGCSETAIARVARRLRTGPGTLSNIIRKRVKSVCFMLGQRIVAAALSDIDQERKRLEAEHAALMDLGAHADPDLLAAVEASLAAAREGLEKMRAGR